MIPEHACASLLEGTFKILYRNRYYVEGKDEDIRTNLLNEVNEV